MYTEGTRMAEVNRNTENGLSEIPVLNNSSELQLYDESITRWEIAESQSDGHRGEDPFQCKFCGKLFQTLQIQRMHLRTHHNAERRFECHVCGNNYLQLKHLKSHIRTHTDEKPFKCSVCGECFIHSSALTVHSRTHSGEKPFKCHVCGKCFMNMSDLTVHASLHCGERPFKCDSCGKSFVRSGLLNLHARTHAGEKPFDCSDFAMDVIKNEPEVDPLAIQWSDNTDRDEKKPLSEEGNLLDLHVAGIKTERVDHSYDLTSDIKIEETAMPTNFVTTKCKTEEELCHLDTIKDELKVEVTAEENEILTDSICSYWVEGKPRKNLNQITCPDRDSNPGHLVSRPDALAVTPQCAVSSTQKFLVQQHITTSKHQANKQLNSKQRQLFLTQPTTSNVRSEFNIDLCRSLISADIPLYKLKNKVFREFLEKYTQHTIPDESTLRKTYAPSIYDETIQKIRDEIKDSSIWVSIDETPDKEGRLVGNVVIGLLSEQYSERILLHCDVLEKCNNKTIVKLFNEAMGILWPKGIMYDNVLFFISDAAPYMVKAGQALSVVYPKLTHFTCVAHAFHRVAEVVRDNFLK
ncbi:hypothetical protein ANN_27605 [Periplaneta americana]|uniref:C2H2-type domain-containing protein n=1 Tax=Periplaneta americana TaxID=6978 RepID=A0ABQ8RW95_PERAM|nr:hypothetical protein ANN_27605 [Periplaneta americana]